MKENGSMDLLTRSMQLHAGFGLAKSGNTAVGQFLTFDVAP